MSDSQTPPADGGLPREPSISPGTESPTAQAPTIFPGDADDAGSPVRVAPPTNEKGRMLLHTGCVTVALAIAAATLAGLLAGLAGAKLIVTGSLFGGLPAASDVATESVAAAAAVALPSVVNVDISADQTSSAASGLPSNHPNVPVTGQGSGVAYLSAPGGGTYIITNDHVVADAATIMVTPSSGEQLKATLVGTDPDTDIAVIRVPGRIPLIRSGSSDKLVVGQLTIAIGSPFGLQHSVSSGVVSGLHRSLPDSIGNDKTGVYPLIDVIQTDAAINPGNSGGALVDREGVLIGINSAIFSDTGQNAGIGFAIPVKTATRVADELIKGGKALHPFLGVMGQTVDAAFATEKKLSVNQGAYVVGITKGTAAEKAGIRAGDVIVALDTTPVRSMDDLLLVVRRTVVGQKVTIALYRGAKKMEIVMTVGDKPKL